MFQFLYRNILNYRYFHTGSGSLAVQRFRKKLGKN